MHQLVLVSRDQVMYRRQKLITRKNSCALRLMASTAKRNKSVEGQSFLISLLANIDTVHIVS